MLKYRFAIPLILCATFFNALQGAFVKSLSLELSQNVIVFGRCIVNMGLLALSLILVPQKKPIEMIVKTKRLPIHALRAFSGIFAIYLYYYCLKSLSLSIATLLFFSAPLFVPFVARIWLGIKLVRSLFWGVMISFIGIILIVRPGTELFQIEVMIGLLSGLCVAIASVSMRRLHHSENTSRIMFYYFLAGILLSGILLLVERPARLTQEELCYLFALGVITSALQGFMTAAYKYGTARLLSPFLFMSVVFSLVLDILLWNRIPDLLEIVGMVLIALGATLTAILYPRNEVIPK